MLTNEDKKQILTSLLETVNGISDKEYQKRVWIRGEGPEVDDFDETCCNFFPEGDAVLEKHAEFGITEFQYQQLKKFRDEFRVFAHNNDFPEEFIDTPKWRKIMEMAGEVLKAFNCRKVRK